MNGLTSNGLLYLAEGAKSTITNYDQAHPRA
jgi:hypothetical protein